MVWVQPSPVTRGSGFLAPNHHSQWWSEPFSGGGAGGQYRTLSLVQLHHIMRCSNWREFIITDKISILLFFACNLGWVQISKSDNEYVNVLFSFPDIEVAGNDRKSDDVWSRCWILRSVWSHSLLLLLQTSPVIILTLIPPTLLLTSQLD